MNSLLKIGSACALLLAASVPALADDTSSSSSASSSMLSSSSEVSSSSSASSAASAEINYGQIISAIQANKMADLSTITESSTINFVLVSDIKANGDATALENAMEKNSDATTLKTNVESNAILKDKLTAANYTSNQVVAVIANDDGSFTVVINDQHP